jgi:hypothetical protein
MFKSAIVTPPCSFVEVESLFTRAAAARVFQGREPLALAPHV